jgi:long-chain acyl-CoA synthetase
MFDLKTMNDVFVYATGRGQREVMVWQDGTDWKPITSNDLYGKVRALASVLKSWDVAKGDRVAILSENRWEWPVSDFATLVLGAVDVPLYATLTPDQVGYMLRDSGAKVAIVSTKEQHQKLVSAGDLPMLEHVIVMDDGEVEGAESLSHLLTNSKNLQQPDAAFDEALGSVLPDDLATIIYTSGTTGESKGVMLTHGNLASNINVSTEGLGFTEQDTCISFLPLSHVTARHVDYALMCHGARLAYCPRFDLLPVAMKAVRPTIFVAVPRVYEKIRQAVEAKSASSAVRKRLLGWALATGREHRKEILSGMRPHAFRWQLADKLVFSKIREAFGGRVKVFNSGGAPLGMDTAGWFADTGIRIFEGYGLTETSPVIAVNDPSAHRIGSVGKPLPNVEVRFAQDGELEVRGPSIFRGYWRKEKESAESFTADGWFKTGDIGAVDEQGFLSITDRKKELLKTSGGKLIAPQPIENRLKANSLVAQAALVGDKHKFASVLISPNFQALEGWAKGQGLSTEDRSKLVREPGVVKQYQGIVDQVNGQLAHFESIKRMCVVGDEWTVEQGELTPSMKLKRRVIETKYAKEIATFYEDEASSRALQ